MFPEEQCLPDIGFEEPTLVGVTWRHRRMCDCGVVAWWAHCDTVNLDTVSSDHMGPGVLQTQKKNKCMLWNFLNNICQGLQLLEGAMVACVRLMVITCKTRRNGSEARAASRRDPG